MQRILSRICFFVLLIFASYLHTYQYELSICAIFQNEAPYLKEWIEYHQAEGVEHFYLYNNDSTDDYLIVLEPYLKKNVVELINWPSKKDHSIPQNIYFFYQVQSPAYTDAISRAKNKSHWLAIIDIDEFIVPVKDNTITKCLNQRFIRVSGVCVNWQNYGTSHIAQLDPTKSMLEQLVWKMKWDHPQNNVCKSIVQPKYVKDCSSPHYCNYLPKHCHLDTHYQEMYGAHYTQVPLLDVLRINHYWSRDVNYFINQKIPRYTEWNGHSNGLIEYEAEMNAEYDPLILNTQYFKK
jgi:hypothetical protein